MPWASREKNIIQKVTGKDGVTLYTFVYFVILHHSMFFPAIAHPVSREENIIEFVHQECVEGIE